MREEPPALSRARAGAAVAMTPARRSSATRRDAMMRDMMTLFWVSLRLVIPDKMGPPAIT